MESRGGVLETRCACAAVLRACVRRVRARMRSAGGWAREEERGGARAALFVNFDDSVNDGYVPAFDLEHDDLAHAKRAAAQPEEKDVPSLKCRLHAPADK